ncbi:ATP-binding protein [Owenweeksia hongkongensis]|uniref:tetratricopeptide repeat-containing sensor histidine kinase n=2 Tax=Owenweeksia hongkongensis TaxID=253245 RepID=UPI0002DA0E1B
MKSKPHSSLRYPFILVLMLVLLLPARSQNAQQLSPSEIHQLLERFVNYSRDSSYVLLELASKKIEQLQEQDLVNELKAENNLRRTDYWIVLNLDSAKVTLDKAYQYYKKHPDHKKLAEVYVLKAQFADFSQGTGKSNMRDKVLPYFDSALVQVKHIVDYPLYSYIYFERAGSMQRMELWEESFESSILCMKYAELSCDSLAIAVANFLMGRTYHHFGLFNSSEEHIALSVDYAKGMTQQDEIIHIYADVLFQKNKIKLAKENYEKALKIALEKKNLSKAVVLYSSIGQIELRENNFTAAEVCFDKINSILESKNQAGYKTLLFMAHIHFQRGELTQVKEDLNLFKAKYSIGSVIPRSIDVYKEAADLHTALNQTDQATFYYKKWGVLKDSLYSYTNLQQLNALEAMYFKELKKNELIQQKSNEIIQQNEELIKNRQQRARMGGLLIVVILIGGGLIYYIRMKGLKENQALKFSLKEKQMEQMIDAQEDERQRLARELHDGIGQSLVALKMQLQFDKNPKATDITVQRLEVICDEVRSLSHQMMPLELKENGLQSAIEQLIEHNFAASPIEVDFLFSGLQNRLPSNIEINVYRIIQELASNIFRHSKASKVGIQLLIRGKKLILIVEDDGKGFDITSKNHGIGINNIYVRLEALGGSIQIQSSPGSGTYTHISIPTFTDVNKKTA